MTKEELKALVNSKIAGQGTQIDLGNALPAILNELIDNMGGGDAPSVIIDLGEVAESETDVTDKIPVDYKPKSGDAIISSGDTYQFVGGIQLNDGQIKAIFGIPIPEGDYNYIYLTKDEAENWGATLFVI